MRIAMHNIGHATGVQVTRYSRLMGCLGATGDAKQASAPLSPRGLKGVDPCCFDDTTEVHGG